MAKVPPHVESTNRSVGANDNPSPPAGTTTAVGQLPNKYAPSAVNKNHNPQKGTGSPAAAAATTVVRTKIEERPCTRVAGGGPTTKTLPSQVRRPQSPSQKQQTVAQASTAAVVTAEDTAVEGVNAVSSSNSSNSRDDEDNLPMSDLALVVVTATDGYVSFSESDTELLAPSPALVSDATATTSATSVQPRSAGGHGYNDDHRKYCAAGDQEQHNQPIAGSKCRDDDASGDDKWDFGDEDSDDELENGGGAVDTNRRSNKSCQDNGGGHHRQQSSHVVDSNSGGKRAVVVVGPGSPRAENGSDVGGENNSTACESQQARVAVDRLGRRENAPRR